LTYKNNIKRSIKAEKYKNISNFTSKKNINKTVGKYSSVIFIQKVTIKTVKVSSTLTTLQSSQETESTAQYLSF